MKRKRTLLLLLPFLLTSCNKQTAPAKLKSIYKQQPLAYNTNTTSMEGTASARLWYNQSSFQVLSHGIITSSDNIDTGEKRKVVDVLIHNMNRGYIFYGRLFENNKNEKTLIYENVETKRMEITCMKNGEYVDSSGSADDGFADFKRLLYQSFSLGDPNYKTYYPKHDKDSLFGGIYNQFLFSLVDYPQKDEYKLSNGEIWENTCKTEVISREFKENGEASSLKFVVKNVSIGASLIANQTEYSFEYKDYLPISFSRNVQYESETGNYRSGYDRKVLFSYDDLPNDPYTLFEKDFNTSDETGLLTY